MMERHGITDTAVLSTWLGEEKTYLQGLKSEPVQETLEMEYYTKLVALGNYEYAFPFLASPVC